MIIDTCRVAEDHLVQQREAAAAARAARTPEESDDEREFEARRELFHEFGYGGRRRRQRPEIPRELTDDVVLEFLALLGPDLGEDGEHILHRVARDAPWHLAPAVEQPLTGPALAGYARGLLADLVEAYYLDEDGTGADFYETGVRDHRWHGLGPLAAWYRGPFMALFQSDLRRGVKMLNRLLNHASLARARRLASLDAPFQPISDEALDQFRLELAITGVPHLYVGDDHVWLWYRGTGVGPYPCMSALQGLERWCDQLLAAGVPLDRLVPLLLEGCENLAMLGFVVGMLVRHLDAAGTLLDPYLAEPAIWQLEFARVVHESGGLAASSEGLVAPDRRKWSFREVSMWLVLHADTPRVEQLRAIGTQMVAAAGKIEENGRAKSTGAHLADQAGHTTYTTMVRNWASGLDLDRYRTYADEGTMYVQSIPPEDVQAALEPGNENLRRGQEAIRIQWRYFSDIRAHPDSSAEIDQAELVHDLITAKELLEDPPTGSPLDGWDAAVAVAAKALEACILRGMTLPPDAVEFSVKALLAVSEGARRPNQFDVEEAFFPQGADRIAARALPLLLLPAAKPFRSACIASDGDGEAHVAAACRSLARVEVYETRLNLGRGLDALWSAPCESSPCHHQVALDLAVESMRDSVLGDWDTATQKRDIKLLADPVDQTLAAVADRAIYVSRLDPAIRALGAAVGHDTCLRKRAREVLLVLLSAQRRGLLAQDHDFDGRGSHTLVAARALLSLAAVGDEAPLFEHIAAYADNATRLDSVLRALAAVAEERPIMAETARRLWPQVVTHVLEFRGAGHDPFSHRHSGEAALAALMPTPTPDVAFMYREVESTAVAWSDVCAWRASIEEWIPFALGRPQCVDSLIWLVQSMPITEQVEIGLPWVARIVFANVDAFIRRSYLLSKWLISIRSTAADTGALTTWLQLVDALVVAGDTRLAPYSE